MAGESKLCHLGIICDGNRRWAKEHGLPSAEGYVRGFETVKMIIETLRDTEADFVSFFVFSTENWDRNESEVNYLMKLAQARLSSLTKKAEKENLRLVIMGRPGRVAPEIWEMLMDAEDKTTENTGKTVCICFNYGGQWEIVDAVNRAMESGEKIQDPADFAKFLYYPEVPPCDLIVRTSGEQRISGFQLWRAAYAEFLFLDKYFPALEKEDIMAAIDEYYQRQRRLGK